MKEEKTMQRISKEAKESIIKKAVNRGDKSISCIAEENGVGRSTLSRWLSCFRKNNTNFDVSTKPVVGNNLSRPEKFNHLMNTGLLDEISLGIYCRKHGLYSHQLEQWRRNFMVATQSEKSTKDKAKLKELSLENKQLKKDLRIKEKALAEASALLVLKKKATLIWGELEGD